MKRLSPFDDRYVAAWIIWIVSFFLLEVPAFILETFFKNKRYPTLSSVIVKVFGVSKSVAGTFLIAAFLILHWQWVADNLRTIWRKHVLRQ